MSGMEWLKAVDAESLERVVAGWCRGDGPWHLLALLPEPESSKVPLIQSVCAHRGIPVAGAVYPELIAGSTMSKAGAVLLRVANAPKPLQKPGKNVNCWL